MPVTTNSSHAAGSKLATQLLGDQLKGIFILSDGLNVNGTDLIQGVNEVVRDGILISGGLAGDGSVFKRTWVLEGAYPVIDTVSMIGFYGDNIEIRTSSVGGWDAFGPERKITKSKSNILYELDHKPALELYKEYLGKKADELPGSALLFPLTLKSDYMDREGIVRTVLSVDETENSMTFAGDVPSGSTAQLMHANFDRLIEGASTAAMQSSFEISNGDPVVNIAISCVGRRLVLGERIEDETEAVLSKMPEKNRATRFLFVR